MHRFSVQSLIALIVVANLSLGQAAAPTMGIVTAKGNFTIDNSIIAGNATLFEGNTIETGRVNSQLQLNNGAKMQLAAESRGIVYRDRLVLEKGNSRFENAGNYQVEALSLRINPDGKSAGRVSVMGSRLVQVAALSGPVRVTNAAGALLANVEAGNTLEFTPEEAGAPTPTTVTGCVMHSGSKFELTDEVSAVKFEVVGAGIEKEVGHRVEVSGSIVPDDAANQVRLSTIKQLSKRCSNRSGGAAAAGAAGGSAAGGSGASTAAATGMAVATKAIIAGVIVAGAATGAAVAVVNSSDDSTTLSPSTR